MIHFELCYKKYHRSIIKNVIKASLKRHEAFLIAKLPTLQELPKNRQTFGHSVLTARATGAQRLVYWCPTLGLLVPNAWSVDAQRLVPECPLNGQDRPLDGL